MTLLRLRSPLLPAVAIAILLGLARADAAVVITVDKSAQRMSVSVDGQARHSWPVSTGRAGFGTPSGSFSPVRLERTWFSREYYNSPMPYSIFFHRGYAIHGSYEISRLGGPASHGCVRLHPSNAATLFNLVKRHGAGSTRILVTGNNPPARQRPPRVAERNVDQATPDRSSYRSYHQPFYAPPGYYGRGPYGPFPYRF